MAKPVKTVDAKDDKRLEEIIKNQDRLTDKDLKEFVEKAGEGVVVWHADED